MMSHEAVEKEEKTLVTEIVNAIMTACFAYIGYAVGGLLLAAMANANAASTGAEPIDIEAAGANFKMQFMFIVAFVVNTFAVFWVTRKWLANQINLWIVFLLFWFLDTFVPWLYQSMVFGSSFIPTVILLGFFPAVIIAISIRMNHRKMMLQESTQR